MKSIGNKLKLYFSISVVLFSSRYITFQGGTPLLVGFTDLDSVNDPDDRKSTTGYVFNLHSGPVTWACKKQHDISLSSAEADYQATVNASREALWL
jgi:hypothetical protein